MLVGAARQPVRMKSRASIEKRRTVLDVEIRARDPRNRISLPQLGSRIIFSGH